jgi:hypothetical protein
MTLSARAFLLLLILMGPVSLSAENDGLDVHADYYLGFSQGAYYGLMLAGIEYDVAWCVKGELDYEAASLGSGSDFQENIDRIFNSCSTEE